jgi:uncharacterized protein (DUF885 family)
VKAKVKALQDAGRIDEARAGAFREHAASTMVEQMAPAYQRLIAWLDAERANADAEPRGVHALPDGEAFYAFRLKQMTTTGMTADEIHELGLSEVARLRAEMEAVKAQTGFTGTLDEFFVLMRTNPRFILPSTDAGRAQYIKLAEEYLEAMTAKLPEYFGILPKGQLVVRRVEPFREQPGAAQHYMPRIRWTARGPACTTCTSPTPWRCPFMSSRPWPITKAIRAITCSFHIAQELTDMPTFRTQHGL